MKKKITILMIALLLVTIFVTVGCKKEETAPPATPAAVVEQKVETTPATPAIDKEACYLKKQKNTLLLLQLTII